MTYKDLLNQSNTRLNKAPDYISGVFTMNIFSTGAKWMHERMNETRDTKTAFDEAINFGGYGLFKYGTCIGSMLVAAWLLWRVHILLTPLSVIVFYFVEVHLLFLFPILIDRKCNPIMSGIQQTYKTGVLKAMSIVIPISIFMIFGLFNLKAPFRNWHTGSLAIIIWYQHEVSNRGE